MEKATGKGTRILGFRLNPENPGEMTPVEVDEETYFAMSRPAWAHRDKMRKAYKCALDNPNKLWKCDGDCELCEYQREGHDVRLDKSVGSEGEDGLCAGDLIPSDAPSPEEVTVNKIVMTRLLERLAELCPEAMRVAQCMTEKNLSIRQALKETGFERERFRYNFRKVEKQLCNEFGVDTIRRLFDD